MFTHNNPGIQTAILMYISCLQYITRVYIIHRPLITGQ